MPMHKENYEAIADYINFSFCDAEKSLLDANLFIDLLSEYLKNENPRFNIDKFKEACHAKKGKS